VFLKIIFQGDYLYMVFEHKCVSTLGSVCTQPPYNGKNPPTQFLIPCLGTSGLQIVALVMSQMFRPHPQLLTDSALLS